MKLAWLHRELVACMTIENYLQICKHVIWEFEITIVAFLKKKKKNLLFIYLFIFNWNMADL